MFVSRALNYSRREFLPTYIGLRLMLEGYQEKDAAAFLTSYISRKASTGRNQVYRNYQIYKGKSRSGTFEYRSCLATSPTSLLAETYTLERMAEDGSFSNKPYVYSYNWPSPKSAHCYQYFFSGYHRRNWDIAAMFSDAASDKYVLLLDLKSFYPSIDRNKTLGFFREALGHSSLVSADRKIADFVATQALLETSGGVPIGPPISHALANFAFDDIDEKLWKTFPGHYFRYVDDIAIITEASSADSVAKEVFQIVSDNGYVINDAKTHLVRADEWIAAIDGQDPQPNFCTLRDAITILLTVWPAASGNLENRLRSHGFNLPLSHFSRIARGAGFGAYIKSLFNIGWLSPAAKIAIQGPAAVTQYALDLRTSLERRLTEISDWQVTAETFSGKVNLRRLSRLVHVMLYMYPPTDLGFLIPCIPATPETSHLIALIRACADADASEILWYPGKTVSTFAQLWAEAQLSPPKVNWPSRLSPQARDAAATLALTGVTQLPERFTAEAPVGVDSSYLAFCTELAPSQRESFDFSYDDELRTLQIGSAPGTGRRLLRSRYDHSEEVLIEGLYLGSGVSS